MKDIKYRKIELQMEFLKSVSESDTVLHGRFE